MTSKKTRKIVSISIISFVVALTLVVILLAVIPKKQYDPVNTKFNAITIYRETSNGMLLTNDSSKKGDMDKILELHEKSLKDSVLSSMFQGTSTYKANVYHKTTSESSIYNKSGVYALVFSYPEAQTVTLYGEDYKYSATSTQAKTITYERAVLVVTNTSSFEEATLYFITDIDDKESECYIKFLAHQSELYDFIAEYDGVMAQA